MDKQTFMEFLGKSVEAIASGTNILMDELLRYVLITTLLKVALTAAVTAFIWRLILSGHKYLELCEPGIKTDVWRGIFRAFAVGTIVGALLYSYADIITMIKVTAAPNIYLLETLNGIVRGGK